MICNYHWRFFPVNRENRLHSGLFFRPMCCFSNCLTQTSGNRNRETIRPEQANNRGDNRDNREQGAHSWVTEASVEGMLSLHSDSSTDAIFMELLSGGADSLRRIRACPTGEAPFCSLQWLEACWLGRRLRRRGDSTGGAAREPLAPSNRRPYSSGALRSRPESAAHKLCAHRLAVQDVALSRRKQGFDPPWARHRSAASSPDQLKAFAADVNSLKRDVLWSRNLILVPASMLGDLVDHGAADQIGLVQRLNETRQPTRCCLSCGEGCGGLALRSQRVVRTAGTRLRSALPACARKVSVCKIPASSSADVVNTALPLVQ